MATMTFANLKTAIVTLYDLPTPTASTTWLTTSQINTLTNLALRRYYALLTECAVDHYNVLQTTITALANTLDTANAWDDGTGATGAFFQVRVGSRTLPRLGLMNSPYGLIGARQPIEVHFGLEQGPLEVWGVNFGAAEVVACAQVAGEHYSELPSRGDR